MKEIVLIKLGEIALKGLNRFSFEDALKKNIKSALYGATSRSPLPSQLYM